MIDGSNITNIVFFALLFMAIVSVVIIVFIIKSRQKIFSKELEKKDLAIQFQKEVLQATILTQEAERQRIAKDLHDEISSNLNVVSLHLHSLKSIKKTETEKYDIIDTTIGLNNKVIETSRSIAHNLLPPVLEKFGLHTALEELVLDYVNTKSVTINYENKLNFFKTSSEKQLQIFRIIQELINNSIKHGKAKQISIQFENQNNKPFCNYKDNGMGLDTLNLKKSKGLGMQNIESRIEFLNGKFSIQSENEKGFIFSFDFEL